MDENNNEVVNGIIRWLRNYCSSNFDIGEMLHNKKMPDDFLHAAGERGLFGIRIPPIYGGLELPMSETVKIIDQISAIDVNIATFLIVQHTFCYPILLYAKPLFRDFYLPQFASGKCLGCFALSEPDAGSNPRKINTSIVPAERGKWKINGTKCWITGAATADMYLVFGRHEEESGYKGISCFAVPKTTAGIEVQNSLDMLSINGVGLRTIIFKDVEIGEEYLIGELGKGMIAAESGLLFGRLFTGPVCTGIMKRCSQFMNRYASKRNIGSGLLLDSPVTAAKLREIDIAVTSIEAMDSFIAEKIDSNQEIPEDFAIACKVLSSELAWETADKSVQLLGARGLDERNLAARILCDTRFFRIGEGPTEPLLMKLGVTLALTNSRLMRYLRDDMQVTKVYESLTENINHLKQLIKEKDIRKEMRGILYYAIGKTGMWSFLEAALICQADKKKVENVNIAIDWIRNKTAQILCEVQCDIYNVSIESAHFDKYRKYYDDSIGTIEETMPHNRIYMDEFLKCSPVCPDSSCNDNNNNDNTIIDLFQKHVISHGETDAIIDPEHIISYKELNNKVNRMCFILKENGVMPGDVVAIAMDRSAALIISMLAVLKSGAAILMINVQDPKERSQLMFHKANVKFAITTKAVRHLVPEESIHILCADMNLVSGEIAAEEFPNMAEPSAIAYIGFTSGSTGEPKGVRVNHKAVCSQISARSESVKMKNCDRILHSVAPNFDIALWETLSPFVYGCSIVLSNEKIFCWEPRKIIDLITRFEVTHIQATPTQLGLLLDNLTPNTVHKLKCVFSGGEVLPDTIKEQFQNKLPGVELIHLYGPTEAVIDTCFCKPLSEKDYFMGEIGLPFSNKQVYILDEAGSAVSDNTPGELYISGDIGQDYINDIALTEKSFLKTILPDDSETVMYKTGDIVKRTPSGKIQFLYRMDEQIKINGVRIEAGEIETTLGRYPGMGQVKAVVRKVKNNKVLAAYYTSKNEEIINENDLRDFASEYLPKAMIPSKFIQMKVFPVTSTGKINVNLLPDLAVPDVKESMVINETENPIADTIAGIWEELLDIRAINESADFFEMGGNSLMVIQLLTRIWEIYSVEIDVIDFYENPTIKGLWQRITDKQETAAIPYTKEVLAGTQKNYWYLYKMNEDSPAYNCPEAVRLKGKLNIGFLEWSLNQIINRHEALRTLFIEEEGEPFQVVVPEEKYELPVADLSMEDTNGQEEELIRLLEAEASRPLKLDIAPLFAAKLFKLNDNEFVFFWNFHHIIADGWSSAQVFTRELNELYKARCENREPVLPEIEMQPIEYLRWRKKTYTSQRLEKQKDYWLEELKDAPSEVDMTLGGEPVLSQEDLRGHRAVFKIPDPIYDSLKAYSAKYNISNYHVLVTAFASLAHILSGLDDICLGTVVAGRKNSRINHVIGNFANVVVLRCIFKEDSTVQLLVEQMKNKTLKALDNSDIPFEEVVSSLKPNRDKYKNPLFNIFFSLFNGKEEMLNLCGLENHKIPMDPANARFDLSMAMFEVHDRLEGYVEYKDSLYNKKTIERIIKYFIKMLTFIITSPDQCVDQAELVDEEEKDLLCRIWNDTYAPFPRETCMHVMFEQQAEKVPDKTAVCFNGNSLTYRELNARANKLARYLNRNGIQKGAFVGICARTSIEMMVGILGIVKAGAAYVPIDPVLPQKRVQFMLDETDSKIVVTMDEFSQSLLKDKNTICLDTQWEEVEKENGENLNLSVSSDQIIYMIYTSGSTGTPKAVRTMHYNVAALLCNSNHMQPEESDRFLKINNFAFDISTWEIWTPLIYGATMVIMPDDIKLKPLEFAEFVDKNEITMAYLPTALFHAISIEVPAAFRKMRFLIVGGEALDPTRARAVLSNDPPQNFINALGPTEVTCSSAWYEVHDLPENALTVPIGRPVSNTQFYVLNSKMKVLPAGVTGELFIGGAGVSDGYHHRPDLTERNFIHNPFEHDEKFSRIYRSGDLVQYKEDGNLISKGRKDHQIKIRGFRIEIGEIENAIREHVAVNTAAVVVKGNCQDDYRLIAYISLKSGYGETSADDVKKHLLSRLPYYMLPSVIQILTSLPTNKNGKIDRKKLDEIDLSESNIRNAVRYPRNVEEIKLAGIWESVIGSKAPDIQCDFFRSGGDSLKAIRFLSLIEKEFSVQLPMEPLFDHGTIEELAAIIRKKNKTAGSMALISFNGKKESADRPLFLVHPLSGSSICYNQFSMLVDNPVFGLQQLGNNQLKDNKINSIEELASYYLDSIHAVPNKEPYLLGGWSMGGLISFEMARQLENEGHIVDKIILFDSAAPGKYQAELDMGAILKRCLEEAMAQYGVKPELDFSQISPMDADGLYEIVLKELKSGGALPGDTEVIELRELVDTCTKNIEMLNSYKGGIVNSDIVLLHPRDSIQSDTKMNKESRYFGWENFTNGKVELLEADGDHMSMIFEPNVQKVAKILQKYLKSN